MPLLQLADGRIIRVEQYEVVPPEEVRTELSLLQEKVSELQSFLPVAAPQAEQTIPTIDGVQPPAPAEAPAAPADANPVVPEQPAVEQPPLQ